MIARPLVTLGLVAALVTAVAACDSAGAPRQAGVAANTSAPAGAPRGPIPSDPGPGPTTIAGVNVRVRQIATLDTPVDLVPRAGSSDLYAAEQGGKVRIIRVDGDTHSVDPASALDLSDTTTAEGERGLLGIAFSNDGSASASWNADWARRNNSY